MASSDDIAIVRKNVDEPTEATYSDEWIDKLIDATSVVGASAKIWEEKAATYAGLVNTSEAGASHAFSDLHKNALNMAKAYRSQELEATLVTPTRVRVRKIVRS